MAGTSQTSHHRSVDMQNVFGFLLVLTSYKMGALFPFTLFGGAQQHLHLLGMEYYKS